MSTKGNCIVTLCGYLEYTMASGFSVHQRNIMITLGILRVHFEKFSLPDIPSTLGDTMSTQRVFCTLEGYHEYTGGYHDACWEYYEYNGGV